MGARSAAGIMWSVASAVAVEAVPVERVLAGWATQADREKPRLAAAPPE